MKEHNKEKKNNPKLKPWAVVALVLCALVIIYSATTAWLTGSPLNPVRLASLEDFAYQTNVYFLQDDSSRVYAVNDDGTQTVNTALLSSTGAVLLSTQEADVNYIGKLRVEAQQLGDGVAFTRLNITHEWLYNGSSRLQGDWNLPLVISTDFADKREADGYIYHKGAFPTDRYVDVVTGFDSANFDASAVSGMSGIQLSLNVTVDAVQFNRYEQVWGMSARPWAD